MHRGVHDVVSLGDYVYSLRKGSYTFCDTLYHLCGVLVGRIRDNCISGSRHQPVLLPHGELSEESARRSSKGLKAYQDCLQLYLLASFISHCADSN